MLYSKEHGVVRVEKSGLRLAHQCGLETLIYSEILLNSLSGLV